MNDDQQRVWLILAKFRVLGDNPIGLTTGSEALVQCFVPQTIIELALKETDEALRAQNMMRTDVIKCVNFEGSMEDYDVPDFVKRDVKQARARQEAVIGTFFTSPDTASYQSENDRAE